MILGENLEIWLYFLIRAQLGFSSKIEVPRLGSAPSARAVKFQLELISSSCILIVNAIDVKYFVWTKYET